MEIVHESSDQKGWKSHEISDQKDYLREENKSVADESGALGNRLFTPQNHE